MASCSVSAYASGTRVVENIVECQGGEQQVALTHMESDASSRPPEQSRIIPKLPNEVAGRRGPMSEPEPEHAVPQRPGHHNIFIKAFPFLSPHFLCYPAARRDSDRGCYCSPIPILMTSLLNGQVNLEVNGTAVTESVIVPPLDSAAPPPCPSVSPFLSHTTSARLNSAHAAAVVSAPHQSAGLLLPLLGENAM